MDDPENPELTPANDNPWYWLATVYGEQTGGFIDENLEKKNRIAWNAWVAAALSEEKRKTLIENGFTNNELTTFSDLAKTKHYAAALKRSGREDISLPNPFDRPDFSKNYFEKNCAFKGYLFPQGVTFASATFSQEANFSGAIFLEDSYFSSATFTTFANFNSTTFMGAAVLNLVTIKQLGLFMSATFDDFASFKSSIFKDGVSFTSAKFAGETVFEAVVFSGPVNFDSAEFKAPIRFNDARFNSLSSFINATFSSKTAFSGAHFPHFLPEFFGAAFHEGTRWDRAKWPRPPIDQNEAQMQVPAYERLKQEMEKLKKHEDEQFFFRKELRARRELQKRWSFEWWMNFIYEWTSDYGHSATQPIFWFIALFEIGVLVWLASSSQRAGLAITLYEAGQISIAKMLGSFSWIVPVGSEIKVSTKMLAQFFSAFQSLAGLLLIFLFLLGLRNRFRLR